MPATPGTIPLRPPELISTTDIAKFQHTTGAVSCVSSATQSCNTTVSPDRAHYYDVGATVLAGSGLRSGFVNTDHLPYYIQTDLGLEKGFAIPHMGEVRLRAAVVNLFDNTYQIRNGSGIGVQSTQYGPRRTFFFGVNI